MSYRCDNCKAVVPPKTSANKLVTKTKPVEHVTIKRDKNGFSKELRYSGTAIVKEEILCPRCYETAVRNLR